MFSFLTIGMNICMYILYVCVYMSVSSQCGMQAERGKSRNLCRGSWKQPKASLGRLSEHYPKPNSIHPAHLLLKRLPSGWWYRGNICTHYKIEKEPFFPHKKLIETLINIQSPKRWLWTCRGQDSVITPRSTWKGEAVECVSSIQFPSLTVTEDLSWGINTASVVRKSPTTTLQPQEAEERKTCHRSCWLTSTTVPLEACWHTACLRGAPAALRRSRWPCGAWLN